MWREKMFFCDLVNTSFSRNSIVAQKWGCTRKCKNTRVNQNQVLKKCIQHSSTCSDGDVSFGRLVLFGPVWTRPRFSDLNRTRVSERNTGSYWGSSLFTVYSFFLSFSWLVGRMEQMWAQWDSRSFVILVRTNKIWVLPNEQIKTVECV